MQDMSPERRNAVTTGVKRCGMRGMAAYMLPQLSTKENGAEACAPAPLSCRTDQPAGVSERGSRGLSN
jgi:hypothetical protein